MKKSYNPISDVRNESVELSRRLYRWARSHCPNVL